MVIRKLQLVILKPRMVIWKLKLAILKVKHEHVEAQNGQCGASTVFKEIGQTKGGTPQDPPKKLQIVEQTTF